MEKNIKTIGILGGSGALGSGLSYRLGKEGYQILIGSRNKEKASKKVNEINKRLKNEKIDITLPERDIYRGINKLVGYIFIIISII